MTAGIAGYGDIEQYARMRMQAERDGDRAAAAAAVRQIVDAAEPLVDRCVDRFAPDADDVDRGRIRAAGVQGLAAAARTYQPRAARFEPHAWQPVARAVLRAAGHI